MNKNHIDDNMSANLAHIATSCYHSFNLDPRTLFARALAQISVIPTDGEHILTGIWVYKARAWYAINTVI